MSTADPRSQSTGAPPGYADLHQRGRESDAARPLFFFSALLLATSIGAAHECVLRQTNAYLSPGEGPPRYLAALAAAVGALLGAWLGGHPRRVAARDRLPWLLLAAALITGGSAAVLFFAFARNRVFTAVALVLPGLTSATVFALLRTSYQALRRPASTLGVFQRSLRAVQLVLLALGLGALAAATTSIGLLRTSALLGIAFGTLAFWCPTLLSYLDGRPPRFGSAIRIVSVGVLCAAVAGIVGAEAWVSVQDLRRYPSDIVYARTTDRRHYVVTSAQQSFALFVDDQLRFSTVDEQRYHEALVHPAMAAASRHASVLVLGGGAGLVERELLRYPDVEQVTVVVVDWSIVDLARQLGWLRRRSGDSMSSPRVRVIQEEPIVWLAETRERFDVVIVDLPDPVDYAEAKNYTRYFYHRLRERLGPNGVAAIQAASPFRSPRTFASVERTLREARCSVLPYHAPIPMLGDWGYFLAARTPLHVPHRVPDGLTFLDSAELAALFHLPNDLRSRDPGVVSTLHEQPLVDVFGSERWTH